MILAALLLLAPASQSVQHLFDVDRANSLIDWDISSPSYTINESPDKFRLDGGLVLGLDSASAPFTSGRLDGALMFTVPTILHGEIPNPIPFLPPLATFDIEGLQVRLTSPSFAINPGTGAFTAIASMLTTAGTLTTGGLLGNTSQPIFGVGSLPTPVNGSITQSGTTLMLFLDLDVNITQTIGTDTFTIVLDGPINATAEVSAANAPVLSASLPLVVGAIATVNAVRMTPGAPTFLAGSITGLGPTPIGSLGVTLGIASPVKVGATVNASGAGAAAWSFTVPSVLAGRSVWFQALQNGLTTQVFGSFAL